MITATSREAVVATPIIVPPPAAEVDSRTRELLSGAIVPTGRGKFARGKFGVVPEY